MAAERIAAEQNNVDSQHNRTDANAKRIFARGRIDKPERFPNVIREDKNEQDREVEKITVHILHDEWERTLAPIALARFAHCAGRRISPECLVIRAAIIITREAEATRRPKNKKRWRK